MKKLNKNQSGFGAIEAILILLIVAITGGVGWYVWHINNTSVASIYGTNSSNTANISPKTDKELIIDVAKKIKWTDAEGVSIKKTSIEVDSIVGDNAKGTVEGNGNGG